MHEALKLVDLDRPELAPVAEAAAGGDDAASMRRLLEHFRTRSMRYHFDIDEPLRDLESLPNDAADSTSLEDILAHRFTMMRETVHFEHGIDWRHQIYDPEWNYSFVRHFHFLTLAEGYRRSGDERFIEELALQMREWDRQMPPDFPRRLDTGIRLTHWVRIFPVIVHSRHFDEELLAIFLKTVHGMAESLNARGPTGYTGGNWGTMEAKGVLHAGSYLPELRRAKQWRDDATECLFRQFVIATHPDGPYRGQSPHYHNVVLRQLLDFRRILKINDQPVPKDLDERHHLMLDFAAAYCRPDLTCAQFGDSDADPMKHQLLLWAEEYDRPDLRYVATHGREGIRPQWQDRLFADGGFAILRSRWEDGPAARWLMFDFGPFGRGGLRLLSIEAAAHGQTLLTLPGRYRYRTADDTRLRFVSTPYQNTVSINNQNQQRNPPRGLSRHKLDGNMKVVHAWHEGYSHLLQSDEATERRSSAGSGSSPPSEERQRDEERRSDEGADAIVHERQVIMIRDEYWIVADLVRVPSGRRFAFAQNWHFLPGELLELPAHGGWIMQYDQARLAIMPLTAEATPMVREAWYSAHYGIKHSVPWLAFEHESGSGWFIATLLIPYHADPMPLLRKQIARDGASISATLTWHDGREEQVTLAFGPEKGTGRNRWSTPSFGETQVETLE